MTSQIICMVLFHSSFAERPDNELPMYGDQYKPAVEKNEWASKRAVELGWKYFYQGDLDTAIKRFNQGWMFDRENPDVYWGFGVIMGRRAATEKTEDNLIESIHLLEMACDKRTTDGRIMGDLAFSHTLLGQYLKSEKQDIKNSKEHFGKAEQLFPQAFKLNSNYPPIVANWSIFFFYTEQFEHAEKKADEAIKMGYRFRSDYMNDLKEKLK